MTVCAIHQPNFFPWAGYFDKIRSADVFIFLDDVAYPKSGSGAGSWCNRVKMLNGGVPAWFGVPIKRAPGVQKIKDVKITNQEHSVKKLIKSLNHHYKKLPGYDEVMTLVQPLLEQKTDSLAEYNMNVIMNISDYLGFKTTFIRQSELIHHESSTALLIELLKQVGADTYLCGRGAHGYQEDQCFVDAGLSLRYQHEKPAEHFVVDLKEGEETLSLLHLLMAYPGHFRIKQ